MANRHRDFDELVAIQFQDIEFSQIYLITLINDEGMDLENALRECIISMGLKVFAEKAGTSIQHVSDFVKKRKKFSMELMDKYLQKVFELKLKVSVEVLDKDVA